MPKPFQKLIADAREKEISALRDALQGMLGIVDDAEEWGDVCGFCDYAPPAHASNCKYKLVVDKARAALKDKAAP